MWTKIYIIWYSQSFPMWQLCNFLVHLQLCGVPLTLTVSVHPFTGMHKTVQQPLKRFYKNRGVLMKSVRSFQFWLMSDKNNRHFPWRLTCISVHIISITLQIFVGAKVVINICFREQWRSHLCLVYFSINLWVIVCS